MVDGFVRRLLTFPAPAGTRRSGPSAAVPLDLDACSDERLAELFVAGEERAFDFLFHRYRDRLFQFVLWHADAGREEAEELLQEVFCQVYRSLDRFRSRSSLRTWLYALARNVCRHRRRRSRSESSRRAIGEEARLVLERARDPRDGAFERIARRERRRCVRRAVEDLPPAQRAVILLRDWEELSYREMAAVLDVPIGTIRSRLFAARVGLARRLGEDEGGPEEIP